MNLPKEFVGEKLAGEIRSKIDQAEMEKFIRPKLHFESNFDRLFEEISEVKNSRDKERFLKEYSNNPRLNSWSQDDKNFFQDYLRLSKREVEIRENQLYQVIKITLLDLVIVDV